MGSGCLIICNDSTILSDGLRQACYVCHVMTTVVNALKSTRDCIKFDGNLNHTCLVLLTAPLLSDPAEKNLKKYGSSKSIASSRKAQSMERLERIGRSKYTVRLGVCPNL